MGFHSFIIQTDNPEMLNLNEMAARAFNEMDVNHDNKVTKDEFFKACMKNDTIAGMLANKVLKVVSTDIV